MKIIITINTGKFPITGSYIDDVEVSCVLTSLVDKINKRGIYNRLSVTDARGKIVGTFKTEK